MPTPSRAFWGPLTGLGLIVAVIAGGLDQASKFWLLAVFDLANKGVVKLMPFVDIVLTWNTGISYGWFQQESQFGQSALLAIKVIAVALLWIWLAKASSRLAAVSLGLIIGGAVGNGVDRLTYGAVADAGRRLVRLFSSESGAADVTVSSSTASRQSRSKVTHVEARCAGDALAEPNTSARVRPALR